MTIHGPSNYANQQLSKTIYTLATSPGDVRLRILQAYKSFHTLTSDHFPEELRKDFEWVMKQLEKQAPVIDYDGRIQKSKAQVSLERMRNSTGVKIAEKLFKLHQDIEFHLNQK